jgi:LacI family transcriptional regulator
MRFKRIALVLGQDLGYCRDVLRGVQAFASRQASWIFRDAAPDPAILKPLTEWQPAGIIAHLFEPHLAQELIRLGKPMVNVTSTLSDLALPLVEVDHVAVGRMAAEHFLAGGFRHFGYFGSQTAGFSVGRERGFREALASAGFSYQSCYADYLPRPIVGGSWSDLDQRVRRWLVSLPKPVALFTSNDVPGRAVAEMCRMLDLHVPETVALLGVDNDELECGLSYPPLSSIAIPGERIGYEAATMLHRMMAGQAAPSEAVFLPPKTVVVRQSSDIIAVSDPDISAVLRFIRQHLAEPIGVETIVQQVPLSRRKLERRFRDVMKRTVQQEIRRVRIEHAKRLLSTTDMSMPAIAHQAGFGSARWLAVVFRQTTDMTPTDFRNQYRKQ